MPVRHVVLVANLLQDVNIIRPIALLASHELALPVSILTSARFAERDRERIWQNEIDELCATTGARQYRFQSDLEGYKLLEGKGGIIFAGSESNLNAHSITHDLFRAAPNSWLRVTLQHGYECVGFLQNREQSVAFGRQVNFAADVICGWASGEKLRHILPSEQSKLYVSGPSALIELPIKQRHDKPAAAMGIVCENLHSVRMNVTGDHKEDFIDSFGRFCNYLETRNEMVALRPHPGGQYAVKNALPLPKNAMIENRPIYKVPLADFAFGISAPSSVLIDMVIAGIPTAVWKDEHETIDSRSYDGLFVIKSDDDWHRFHHYVKENVSGLLKSQSLFLGRTGIVVDKQKVKENFSRLINSSIPYLTPVRSCKTPLRLLFIANGIIPTLQLSFLKPLESLRESNYIDYMVLTEDEMKAAFPRQVDGSECRGWIYRTITDFDPDLIVFCRYAGPNVDYMLDIARYFSIPTILHIDDDLLNVPPELGPRKFAFHNRPERTGTVRTLLQDADLVYCSTEPLKRRFTEQGFGRATVSGTIYCSGEILAAAERRPVKKIGYMGFDHAYDFEIALPPLIEIMEANPEIIFELFGSIPLPEQLKRFGDRIVVRSPVRGYQEFMRAFADMSWDIGICPLAQTEFNAVKANTKWVEYTSVGAAVIASGGTIYDDCCGDACGLLASDHRGWRQAMQRLIDYPDERFELVSAAQSKMSVKYSIDRLRQQVLSIFDQACKSHRQIAPTQEFA